MPPEHRANARPAVVPAAGVLPSELARDVADIEAATAVYATRARAENTRRAYHADWNHFTGWCAKFGAQPLPADPRLVARYLSAHANPGAEQLKVSTLRRRLSAIQYFHREAGQDFDSRQRDLRDVWSGIRRTHGTQPTVKAPTVTEELRVLLSPWVPSACSTSATAPCCSSASRAATAGPNSSRSTSSIWRGTATA